MVQREVAKVLSLTHAQELMVAPRNEWAMVRARQVDEIKAVKSGEQFDIVDRRSWCFSSDTEVLTKRGWIKWPDARKSDLFATRTEDGDFEYHPAKRLIKHWYKGELLLFQNRGANFLVTPNHRLLGRMRDGVRGKFSEIGFYLAEEVAKLRRQDPKVDTCLFRVPVTSKWEGKKRQSTILFLQTKIPQRMQRPIVLGRKILLPSLEYLWLKEVASERLRA